MVSIESAAMKVSTVSVPCVRGLHHDVEQIVDAVGVVARAADHRVGTDRALESSPPHSVRRQVVAARAADQKIVAKAADEIVVAGAAEDQVVAAAAGDDVVRRLARRR